MKSPVFQILFLSYLLARRQFLYIDIANARLSQPSLQVLTVGKSVGRAAHTASTTNIAEGIYSCIQQCLKKAIFIKAIGPDCYYFQRHLEFLFPNSIFFARMTNFIIGNTPLLKQRGMILTGSAI